MYPSYSNVTVTVRVRQSSISTVNKFQFVQTFIAANSVVLPSIFDFFVCVGSTGRTL